MLRTRLAPILRQCMTLRGVVDLASEPNLATNVFLRDYNNAGIVIALCAAAMSSRTAALIRDTEHYHEAGPGLGRRDLFGEVQDTYTMIRAIRAGDLPEVA